MDSKAHIFFCNFSQNGGEIIKYYVYEWFNKDTGDVFYVGKGSGTRYQKGKPRNAEFRDYVNTHNCDVRIVKSRMSEEDAHDLENELIEQYKEVGQCVTNFQLGGRGFQYMSGEKNPMFGRPWYTGETPIERIEDWKRKVGSPGESNPMFGVSPRERMDEETYRGWLEAHRKIVGDKNPNYGNRKLSAFYKKNPDVAKEKQSRPGARNGRARRVVLMSGDGDYIREFDYIGLCAKYLIDSGLTKTKCGTVSVNITKAAKSGKEYCGYYYMFAEQ